jgi:hypothetical protein
LVLWVFPAGEKPWTEVSTIAEFAVVGVVLEMQEVGKVIDARVAQRFVICIVTYCHPGCEKSLICVPTEAHLSAKSGGLPFVNDETKNDMAMSSQLKLVAVLIENRPWQVCHVPIEIIFVKEGISWQCQGVLIGAFRFQLREAESSPLVRLRHDGV